MNLIAYDGQRWRVERLEKAARLACAILSCTREQMDALVEELRDHRGALMIKWRHDYTRAQENAFETAWRECGEVYVIHTYGKLSKVTL